MRVLIVDDEVELARAVIDGLRAESIDVVAEHDGLAGLETATSGAFDAILLDVLMPGMNGFAVCRELRKRGVDTPILMLTAKDGEWDQSEALELGADDFLSKPFSFVVLSARLKALVRRAGTAPVRGRLIVDASRNVAELDGAVVKLTNREFALLSALQQAEGNTVQKHDLVEQVWGESFGGDDNVVEVYVRYLRTKLAEISEEELVVTVRGQGYRLGHVAVTR
jgi:two-component system OmpR family response regulator